MSNDTHRTSYRRLKWIWLLSRCAMPLLAGLYLVRFFSSPYLRQLPAHEWLFLLMNISVGVYLILWLIAEALLCMYRFPLNLGGAVLLVGGFFAQFIALTLTSESVQFAAFTGIYVTFAALYAGFVILTIISSKQLIGSDWKRGLATLIIVLLAAIPPVVMFFPVWAVYGELSRLWQVVNGLLLLVYASSILRSLIDLSVWGKPNPQAAEYDAEWQKWAAPTIILLILAVSAAAIVAGIHGDS